MERGANERPTLLEWLPWEKLLIWGLFLGAVYLLRHFLFIVLLTFLFCLGMRKATNHAMRLLSPRIERPWLERLLVVVGFALVLGVLALIGQYLIPRVVAQGHEMAGRVSRLDPEREFHRFLGETVGVYLLRHDVGGRDDPRYHEEFKKFLAEGLHGLKAYQEFPTLEALLEGGFETTFEEEERHKLRVALARESPPEKKFEAWLKAQPPPPGEPSADPTGVKSLTRRPDLARLERQWREEQVEARLAEAKDSPAYAEAFREYYEERRKANPTGIPYDYTLYRALKKAYPKGVKAFADALGGPPPSDDPAALQRAREDFESVKRQRLADSWWEESAAAQSLRGHVNDALADASTQFTSWAKLGLSHLVTVPVQIGTALLLSFFILIDFPNLKRGAARLRDSRFHDFYDEIAPSLVAFGRLLGMSFYAQTIVSVFNTVLTFVALSILDIDHAVLLAAFTFVSCFIPVFGVFISGAPIVLVAMFQPGGSLFLALEVVVAIVIIHLIETMVIDPRVYGAMMRIHPVLILAVLFVAEYFFGLWGLVLGVPVAVYVISHVIMGETPAET